MAEKKTDTKVKPERETASGPLLGEMIGAKLKLIVIGTKGQESQRILDRMSDRYEHGCDGAGLMRDPDDPSRIMVVALMRDGWQQVGFLTSRDAAAILQVIDKGTSKVQVTDWRVLRGCTGWSLGLEIHVSIS